MPSIRHHPDVTAEPRDPGRGAHRVSRVSRPAREALVSARTGARRHVAWLAAGLAMSFLVPFVLADRLGMQRDLYYEIYIVAVLALFTGWARDTGQDLPDLVRRRWPWALALGVFFAGLSAVLATRAEDAGSHPAGLALVGALLWRGVAYGAADGLLLSAFPILVVFAASSATRLRRRRGGLVAVGAVAMIASVLMTAVYHSGYQDYRSEMIRKPLAGDLVWSVPTLVTLNPIGAPIAHIGLHVGAVLHNSDTELFLPPHASG